MAQIKKKNDKIESKYIKKHYISIQSERPSPIVEAEKNEEKDEKKYESESRYIKKAGKELGRFVFNITNPLICVALTAGIFGIYLLTFSGIGVRLEFPTLNLLLAYILPVILYFSRQHVYFSDRLLPVYAVLVVFTCSIFVSFTTVLDYSWMLKMLAMVTPPLTLSYIGYNTKCIKYISYAYISISMFFAVDYAVGGITAGWNGNAVGIYTLIGVVWLVFLGAERGKRNIILEIIVLAVAATQMVVTNCRSALASLAVFTIFMYLIPKALMKKKLFFRLVYLVALLFPMFVVLIYVWLYESPYAIQLDEWFLENTEKLFFSGREEIWDNVFDTIRGPVFGNGSPYYYANTHSSFVLIFLQVGYSGFFLFSLYFACIFEFLHKFFDDHIVRGSFIAFIVVYISNAFEHITASPHVLCIPAYIMLAVGVGRACFLEKQQKKKEANDDVQYHSSYI